MKIKIIISGKKEEIDFLITILKKKVLDGIYIIYEITEVKDEDG